MLRFAVYDEKGPAADFQLANAHLFGPGEKFVAGRVSVEGGHIVCENRGSRSVGLCLMFDAGSRGKLALRTCLLPPIDRTHNLTIELARHRIAMFVAKSEEWQMFDLSSEHVAMKHWEHARELLVEAMTETDPLRADRRARRSLEFAVDATERLALAHAEILLHRRYAEWAASSTTLGVRVTPGRDSAGLREIVNRDFDVLWLPLSWRDLEVEEGKYNWGPTDRWMDWARKQKKPIIAGPLLDFSKTALPDWMYVWQHDYDTCRDLAYDHVERVVQRYKGVVGFWNLAAGLNINDNFQFTLEQMCDLVRMVRLVVRQARPTARTMIEIVQPFGEHTSNRKESIAPFSYIDRLGQDGIRLDAIGVQLLFGRNASGLYTRDIMEASSLLDRFFLLEMPIIVSSLGVPSDSTSRSAGYWNEPWTQEIQAKWIAKVFGMAMSKPFVESVFWADLFDHAGAALPNGGLIDESGKPKLVLPRLVSMRKRLRKPLGKLKLPPRDGTPGGAGADG